MKRIKKVFLPAILMVSLFLLNGCAAQYPTILETKVSVSQDVNPNVLGQSSPIVVSLYQLANNITFNATDFMGLYQNAKGSLGEDFISQYQFEVAPGQYYNFSYKLDPKTRYIGIVAAYSQINKSAWRQIIVLNPSDYPAEFLLIDLGGNSFTARITKGGV
jgi:type VI secretion system protein VasD